MAYKGDGEAISGIENPPKIKENIKRVQQLNIILFSKDKPK